MFTAIVESRDDLFERSYDDTDMSMMEALMPVPNFCKTLEDDSPGSRIRSFDAQAVVWEPEHELDTVQTQRRDLPMTAFLSTGERAADWPSGADWKHAAPQTWTHAPPPAPAAPGSVGMPSSDLGPRRGAAGPAAGPRRPAGWAGTTTVMMRNLPNRYTQEMVLNEIVGAGFADMFDFFYLPLDTDTKANKGYAFINFIDDNTSWGFKATFDGMRMSRFNSFKRVCVTAAAVQGLEANYAHYSKTRASHWVQANRPIFLRTPSSTAQATRTNGISDRSGCAKFQNLAAKMRASAKVGPPQAALRSSASKPCGNCGHPVLETFRFCAACGVAQPVVF